MSSGATRICRHDVDEPGRGAPEHIWLLLVFEWQGICRRRVTVQALPRSQHHDGIQEHVRVCKLVRHPRSKGAECEEQVERVTGE